MAYHIEILSIKKELYPSIERACNSLNQIQEDFVFKIPSQSLKDKLYLYKRGDYHSNNVFEWLKKYREEAKGDRKYTILVVDGFLKSDSLSNLFGNSNAREGLAVFTINDFGHFANDLVRFCRYYLVRYAMSFVEPSLISHNDPNRKNCIFHKKINKLEIRDSLDSGHICEECYDKLRPKITLEIDKSIKNMLLLVSNQHPFALVIKGGGVKGLAFAGALMELENYFSFDTFAGTSAGAITAILLGSGYTPSELLQILNDKKFSDFKDANKIKRVINLITKGGLYPGKEIENWIEVLVKKKIDKLAQVEMGDLPYHSVVYATKINEGAIIFDSKRIREESRVAFAARCSMSIPFFFIPKTIDDTNVFDGGTRNNFPLKIFQESYPTKPIIALYLKASEGKESESIKTKIKILLWKIMKSIIPGLRNTLAIGGDLIDTMTDGEEKQIVDKNRDKVVIIDPSPIKTTDFNLNKVKKDLLILSGRLGALQFIKKNHPDIIIEQSQISKIQYEILQLRSKI